MRIPANALIISWETNMLIIFAWDLILLANIWEVKNMAPSPVLNFLSFWCKLENSPSNNWPIYNFCDWLFLLSMWPLKSFKVVLGICSLFPLWLSSVSLYACTIIGLTIHPLEDFWIVSSLRLYRCCEHSCAGFVWKCVFISLGYETSRSAMVEIINDKDKPKLTLAV